VRKREGGREWCIVIKERKRRKRESEKKKKGRHERCSRNLAGGADLEGGSGRFVDRECNFIVDSQFANFTQAFRPDCPGA
jgi:hypothetical protein